MPSSRERRALASAAGAPAAEDLSVRPLQAAFFASSFDRILIAPLLFVVARDFHVTVAALAIVLSAYFFTYGTMQLVWGIISDRFGRVRVIQIGLLIAATAGLLTAASNSVPALLSARILAGGGFAAVIPGGLVYVGDSFPVARRQGPLTDLMRATAMGTAVATAVGGVAAEWLSWRLAFASISALTLFLAWFIGKMPERTSVIRRRILSSIGEVWTDRWARVVLLVALGEGFVFLAVLNFIPAALQSEGRAGPALGGSALAAYGLGVIFATPLVKRLAKSVLPHQLILAGIGMALPGMALFWWRLAPTEVALGCLLLGAGWAFLQSTVQTWATQIAPAARGTMIAMFATVLFAGSAAGTFVAGDVLSSGDYQALFSVFLLAALPVSVLAWGARRRFEGHLVTHRR